jgi:hypothetical protein
VPSGITCASTTAPFGVNDLLIAPNAPLPAIPALPAEVTHVWTMSAWNPTSAKLVRISAGAVDGIEGLAEVVGEGVGGSDGVLPGLDLNGAVSPGGLYEFPD